MNRTTTTIIILILTISGLWAQAPDQFSYQIIVRDSQGQPLAGQTLTMDVNVLSGSISGPSVFSESHQVTSTSSGQVSLMVGSVNDLSTIAWENGPFFLQVSANGQPVETRQLLSVPYAKHTMKASQVPTLDYTNLMGTPDFSNWDKDPTDDFDGEFNSLLNMLSLIHI